MTRIIGLDLSLTSSGLATIDTTGGGLAVSVARVESKTRARRKGDPPPSLPERSVRLRKIAGQVTQACAGADLVVVEGPAYSKAEAGVWDRAGLWWLVVARLTGAGLPLVEVTPTSLKTYALGKGAGAGTGKDEVLAAVIRRYMPLVEVPGNNEADALVLAAMGARFTGLPIEQHLPQTHTRAMTGVRWTTT